MNTSDENEPFQGPAATRKIKARDLERLYPALFGGDVKAICIGVTEKIAEALNNSVPLKEIHRAVGMWQAHRGKHRYLQLIAQGGCRYDLDGKPAGHITDEERQAARIELDRPAREAFERHQRSILLKAIEASGLSAVIYARANSLDERATDSAHSRAVHERSIRRAKRMELVERFKASGLTPEEFCAVERIRIERLNTALAKVEELKPIPANL